MNFNSKIAVTEQQTFQPGEKKNFKGERGGK